MRLRLYILKLDSEQLDFENIPAIKKEDIFLCSDEIIGYEFT